MLCIYLFHIRGYFFFFLFFFYLNHWSTKVYNRKYFKKRFSFNLISLNDENYLLKAEDHRPRDRASFFIISPYLQYRKLMEEAHITSRMSILVTIAFNVDGLVRVPFEYFYRDNKCRRWVITRTETRRVLVLRDEF